MTNSIGRLFIFSILFIGFGLIGNSQTIKNKAKTTTDYSALSLNENIIPGTLVLKLKPEYRSFINNGNGLKNHPSLTRNMARFGVKNFTKLIPNSKQPASKFTGKNKPTTDISLIHILEFNPSIPIGEVIELLLSSGLFEYVEPQFKMNPLYLPNDP